MIAGTDPSSQFESDPAQVSALLGNALRDIGIPPCPLILQQINTEMSKDEPDFNYLTRIISADVGISAGLITIANSPFFGFRSRVRSVNQALIMLGLGPASRAIAGLVLRKLFPPTAHLERFWHASANIAKLSGWLASQVCKAATLHADDAYTFGLFRDSGIPMLMKRFGNYPEILKKANDEKELSFTAIEDAVCSINHALVGGLLAQSWWLPEEICLAIRHHHDYKFLNPGGANGLPPATLRLIATAQLAEHLFQNHTGLSRTQEWQKAGASCLHLLGLAEDDLDRLYKECVTIIESE